eukprot:CAMPEP_0116882570 /NCGR_PEP_ID=MMETSP0463-20121206/14849_1 /TAXON_ID=181622 /ORGANISM="Strombidinopsis sp, Strain SopsisLIS2011" /LENGTH=51 /DNA_ID=CAMNT_0004535981 /DNA_START=815 /DNA_END=970 /DNA_ORIENTATION=-
MTLPEAHPAPSMCPLMNLDDDSCSYSSEDEQFYQANIANYDVEPDYNNNDK